MTGTDEPLNHTIAFRVTEKQWQSLLSASQKKKATVPQLAKTLLFEHVGIDSPKAARKAYGQKLGKK